MSGAAATAGLAIRDLVPGDLDAVVRLDALHTGRADTGAVRDSVRMPRPAASISTCSKPVVPCSSCS